jgi:RHS repeat-associated protein
MRTHALNQLTTLAQTGKASQSFAYDYSGRRVRKTTAAFNAAPQLTKDYLYNGEHVYAEYLNSSFTTASAVNNHGAGIDEILSRTTTAGASSETTYLHQDHILSVALQTNATGNGLSIVKGGRIHDAWGNVSQQSPAAGTTNAITNAFGYTGREPEEAGLIYYRARYYDPSIGRFTRQDPIGLGGGINTFAYVNGNPTSLIDPLGTNADEPTGNGGDCPKSDRATASACYKPSFTSVNGVAAGIQSFSAWMREPTTHSYGPIVSANSGHQSNPNSTSMLREVASDLSAPGPWRATEPGEIKPVVLWGTNPIWQDFSNPNVLVNTTAEGHVFNTPSMPSGTVTRVIAPDVNGYMRIYTYGSGANPNLENAANNVYSGVPIFLFVTFINDIDIYFRRAACFVDKARC